MLPLFVINVPNCQCTWVSRYSQMVITLAVEDALSGVIAQRLIGDYLPGVALSETLGNQGIGSIRRRVRDLNQIALYQNPVLVLADLDSPDDCPVNRVTRLIGRLPLSPNLIIRIAVLEVESWILADRPGIAQWLRIATATVPRDVESLVDPKRTLVELARRSRNRALRESISPESVRGSGRTGPGYNNVLGEFVTQLWDPESARLNSPSLDRSIIRIAELASV